MYDCFYVKNLAEVSLKVNITDIIIQIMQMNLQVVNYIRINGRSKPSVIVKVVFLPCILL